MPVEPSASLFCRPLATFSASVAIFNAAALSAINVRTSSFE